MDDLGVLIELGLTLLAIACFVVAIGLGIITVYLLRMFIILIRMGPRAADEAAASGASLSKWWRGEPWPSGEFERRMADKRWWRF